MVFSGASICVSSNIFLISGLQPSTSSLIQSNRHCSHLSFGLTYQGAAAKPQQEFGGTPPTPLCILGNFFFHFSLWMYCFQIRKTRTLSIPVWHLGSPFLVLAGSLSLASHKSRRNICIPGESSPSHVIFPFCHSCLTFTLFLNLAIWQESPQLFPLRDFWVLIFLAI